MEGVWGESLWDANQFAKKIQNRKSPIKTTLLDQQIVAGLGNIYVCEALHRTGIHPEKPANELLTKSGKASKKMVDLVAECQLILKEAILAGGSTYRISRVLMARLAISRTNSEHMEKKEMHVINAQEAKLQESFRRDVPLSIAPTAKNNHRINSYASSAAKPQRTNAVMRSIILEFLFSTPSIGP